MDISEKQILMSPVASRTYENLKPPEKRKVDEILRLLARFPTGTESIRLFKRKSDGATYTARAGEDLRIIFKKLNQFTIRILSIERKSLSQQLLEMLE